MSKETTSEKGTFTVGGMINAISLKKAQKWAKRWVKMEGNYNKHHKLNAFLIPAVDLKELLDEGGTHVRAYIGVQKIKASVKGEKPTYIEKLMFVGTKLDSETGVYVDQINFSTDMESNQAEADGIYDFSTPCPPAGDAESPLDFQ
ncbi:MAG TPA: hypothetical protein VIH09_08695 [Flavobacterium sp.]|uniref:hypothetical protein n=1 Tax=Flavobacterium sp. TaxID=239 RepID=UPI002F3FFD8C